MCVLACLVACDSIVGDGSFDDASTSGSTTAPAIPTSTTVDPSAPPGSSTSGVNDEPGTTGFTGPLTTTGEPARETTGDPAGDTTSSSSCGTTSGSTTSTDDWGGASSSTGSIDVPDDPPVEVPEGVPPDWSLSLDGFDGRAIATLDDGTIVLGGQQDDMGMLHVVDPMGSLITSHLVAPDAADIPASEAVESLARLASGRLAVLVTRGPSDDPFTLDRVFELDVLTDQVGWSATIESEVLNDDQYYYEEAFPGVARQLATTEDGQLYIAGTGQTDVIPNLLPGSPVGYWWLQRLDPASGARLWQQTRILWDSTGSYDVGFSMLLNDPLDRVLIQGNSTNESTGLCMWGEVDPATGESIASDFSIGTGNEYCWRGDTFSDGRVGAPVGWLINGSEDIHVGGVGAAEEYPLDTTDFLRVWRLHVDDNDAAYIVGRLQGDEANALGRIHLTVPPSSTVLDVWPLAEPYPFRAIGFGPNQEVLVLRATETGTVLDQRSLD